MRALLKRLASVLLTPIFLLFWGLLLAVFHVLQMIALRGFGETAHRRVVEALNYCLMQNLKTLGTRVRLRRAPTFAADRPYIFIANHQNQFDIPGIAWYLRVYRPRFVAKIELAKGIPSISYNLRHSGAALIDRSDPRQALREIAKLGKLIEQTRTSAVIFPEGTRSRTGSTALFAAGGVKILLKGAPSAHVVPVCVHGTWKLNRYGRFPMSFGESIAWSVLDPIDPDGMTPEQVTELAQARIAEAMIADTPVRRPRSTST